MNVKDRFYYYYYYTQLEYTFKCIVVLQPESHSALSVFVRQNASAVIVRKRLKALVLYAVATCQPLQQTSKHSGQTLVLLIQQ